MEYLRNPAEIERLSFQRIRAETDLSAFDDDQAQVVMRLVHTCGDPQLAQSLRFGGDAIGTGRRAIETRSAILCDVEMVRQGISRRYCDGPLHCFLNADGVAEAARQRGETRTMAGIERWPEHLEGAIAVIGNAPTALYRLLELLEQGAPHPALVVAMPVGFVGAEESRQALTELAPRMDLPFITLSGRRGGSALAAAAVNALTRMAHGVRC